MKLEINHKERNERKKNDFMKTKQCVIKKPMGQESESEVTQPCLTLCDPMDCSLSGSSIHGIFPGKIRQRKMKKKSKVSR